MPSVGSYLRELRERRGLSLDEIARVTRVPRRYLEALEGDEADVLPTPVFTKGYIRAYCQAVQQPPDEALALYATAAREAPAVEGPRDGAPVEAPKPAAPPRRIRPVERESRSRGPVLVSFVLLVVLGVALFAITLSLQPGRTAPDRRGDTAPPGAPAGESRPGVDAARSMPPLARTPEASRPSPASPPRAVAPGPPRPETPRPTMPSGPPVTTATPAPVLPKPPAAPEPSTAAREPGTAPEPTTTDARGLPPLALAPVTAPFRLVARATEATWVRVRTEDGAMTEETIPAGSMREWASDRPFTVTLGNAGGVTLELNGQPLPRLGPSGAVVRGLVLPPRSP